MPRLNLGTYRPTWGHSNPHAPTTFPLPTPLGCQTLGQVLLQPFLIRIPYHLSLIPLYKATHRLRGHSIPIFPLGQKHQLVVRTPLVISNFFCLLFSLIHSILISSSLPIMQRLQLPCIYVLYMWLHLILLHRLLLPFPDASEVGSCSHSL